MDVKVLCPTLSVMLQKTIVALCEVNIRFKDKLEIGGSLHIRADGEKVLNFLIDEECMKGQRHSREGVARGVLVEPFQKRRQVSDAFNLATDALSGIQDRSSDDVPNSESATDSPLHDAENLLAFASSATSAAVSRMQQPKGSAEFSFDPIDQGYGQTDTQTTGGQLPCFTEEGDLTMNHDPQPPDITQDTGMQVKSNDIVEIPPDLELSCGEDALQGMAAKAEDGDKSENYKQILEQVLSHAMHKDTTTKLDPPPLSEPQPLLLPKKSDTTGHVRLTGTVHPTKIREPPPATVIEENFPPPTTSSAASSQSESSSAINVKAEPMEASSADCPAVGQGIPPFAAAFHRHMSRNLLEMHMGAMTRMAQNMDTSMEDACTMGKLGKKKWQCVLCGLMLSSKFYLKSHINAVHTRSRIFPCEICGKLFYSHGAQRIHKLRNHWVEKRHKCQFCGQLFVLPFELRQHIQKKHDNQTV